MTDELLTEHAMIPEERIGKLFQDVMNNTDAKAYFSQAEIIDLTVVFDMAMQLPKLRARYECNTAILKGRTQEMNKAHDKLKRVVQMLERYKSIRSEAWDKLEKMDEDGDFRGDLDEVEMMAEVYGAVVVDIVHTLLNLGGVMNKGEVLALKPGDRILITDEYTNTGTHLRNIEKGTKILQVGEHFLLCSPHEGPMEFEASEARKVL